MLSRRLLFLALCAAPLWANAQTSSTRVPPKDVAILADVSRSVSADAAKHLEARDLIIKLVTGTPIDWSQYAWTPEVTGNPDLRSLFGQSLGLPGEVPPQPLISDGHNLLILPVGKLSTVIAGGGKTQKVGPANTGELIRVGYPTSYKDNSTCYWYAMARAAELLSMQSPEGYYLFVVSDESDDPDYLEFGAHDHSKNDYQNYVKNLRNLYPPAVMQAAIEKYFKQRAQSAEEKRSGLNAYQPRPDFPMTLIARFYQNIPNNRDESKVRLSWYAMGVSSIKLALPPPKLAAAALIPPAFRPTITPLGGLKTGETKAFHYRNPLLVWQVPYGEANGWSGAQFEVQTGNNKPVPLLQPASAAAAGIFSPRLNGPKTAPLRLAEGKATYQVVGRDYDGQDVSTKTFSIEVRPPNDWLLPVLATVSALCALGIFIWTWLSFSKRTAPLS